MATAKAVWGIDIGQCAVKAIKLRQGDEGVVIESFDLIEHPQILSEEEADKTLLIRAALDQLTSRNDFKGAKVCISVPGQATFTKFVKLPPVDKKKIPEIVKFEAEQQIPFPIEEVVWRYQTFEDPDSPDVEVGLFAMKRTDIQEILAYFQDAGIEVDVVQMAPLALYNYMTFDGQVPEGEATILADVGADKTDLVVADGPRIWTRTIQIGGNNFTEALVRAFKLSFRKAEALKRSAATSKYARQIFQSMRPVFSDLVQEIQRSVGYYTSLHRETRFKRLVGLGSGFKLPGLQKFLEQNLNMTVVRVDTVNNAKPPETNTALFSDNVLSAAVVYGLAAQGLGLTKIQSNLLPEEIETKRRWAAKRPWFVGAAAVVLLSLSGMTYRAFADKRILGNNDDVAHAKADVEAAEGYQTKFKQLENQGKTEGDKLRSELSLYRPRAFWPETGDVLRKVEGALTADDKGVPGAHQALLVEYARQLKRKLDAERVVSDAATLIGTNPAAAILEEARGKKEKAEKDLADAKAALRKILMTGTPGKETEYMDLEARIAGMDKELAGPMTDADYQKTVSERYDAQKKMDELVKDSFSRVNLFRIKSIRAEYVPDVTVFRVEDEVMNMRGVVAGPGGMMDKEAGVRGGAPAAPAPARGPAGRSVKSTAGFLIRMEGTTPLSQEPARKRIGDLAQMTEAAVKDTTTVSLYGAKGLAEAPAKPAGGEPAMVADFGRGQGASKLEPDIREPDPLIVRRETAGDTRFWIVWLFQMKEPDAKAGAEETH